MGTILCLIGGFAAGYGFTTGNYLLGSLGLAAIVVGFITP